MKKRITRDQMLLVMAWTASLRGSCNRLRVGAILAFDSRPVSVGYNGSPPGMAHCGNECNEHSPCKNTIHAEANAINWARAFGIDTTGSTLYITDSPCQLCAELIEGAKISRVVYDREYRLTGPLDWLEGKGVEVNQLNIKGFI